MKKLIFLILISACSSNITEPAQIKCIKKVIPMPEGYYAVEYYSPYNGVACKIED